MGGLLIMDLRGSRAPAKGQGGSCQLPCLLYADSRSRQGRIWAVGGICPTELDVLSGPLDVP
jgi:hypothetical protein